MKTVCTIHEANTKALISCAVTVQSLFFHIQKVVFVTMCFYNSHIIQFWAFVHAYLYMYTTCILRFIQQTMKANGSLSFVYDLVTLTKFTEV